MAVPFHNMNKRRKREMAVYAMVWLVLFLIPPMARYIEILHGSENTGWQPVWHAWIGYVPFILLFTLHDVVLAPLLLNRTSRKRYCLLLVVAMMAFGLVQTGILLNDHHGERPHVEAVSPPPPPHEMGPPEEHSPKPHDMEPLGITAFMHVVMALMMCGFNDAVKLLLKSSDDELQLAHMEREKLQKEIDFLTYQINPHFFMNTLNNIHALVDISPSRAQQAIIELSRLMRYVLYDGTAKLVPIAKELSFISSYIALMRLRFTQQVDIVVDAAVQDSDAQIPPLLLATFVENAFKHGVSYRNRSHVHVALQADDGTVRFRCANSLASQQAKTEGGVGLANVRKRLELMYGNQYSLSMTENDNEFIVTLEIPSKL